MNLEELIEKAKKGELTDAEKQAFSDSIAAAARKDEAAKRKTEKERADALQAKLDEAQAKIDDADNAGKTAAEKEKAALEKALSKAKAAEDKAAKVEAEYSAHRRNAKLESHLSKLEFVDPKAREIARLDFAQRFKDLDEKGLDDEATLKPILETVRGDYKALLKDTSGHGGGSKEKGSGSVSSDDPAKQSDSERLTQLRTLSKS